MPTRKKEEPEATAPAISPELLAQLKAELRAELRAESQTASRNNVLAPAVPVKTETIEKDGKEFRVDTFADGVKRETRLDYDEEFARMYLRSRGRRGRE